MLVEKFAAITEERISSLRKKDFWLHNSLEEAKKHLSPRVKYDFVFNLEDLSDSERNKVEIHINECKMCADEVTTYKDNYNVYANLPDLEY